MKPEQPTSWPPAPNVPLPPIKPANLHLLTGNAKTDKSVGSLIAFLYLLMALVLRNLWQRDVSARFLLARELVRHHATSWRFFINADAPLVVVIVLAPVVYSGLKRSAPVVGKAFGEYILIMIAIYTIGDVILPLITGNHHRY